MQDHSTLPLFSLQPETKEIHLNLGKVTIVDVADYDWLMQWNWFAFKHRYTWYAYRNARNSAGNKITIGMHRVIMNALSGTSVDHKDGNGLNNVRSNLRLCVVAENNRNSRMRNDNTSGYKGVHLDKSTGKWRAMIRVNGKRYHLGSFDSPESAALAYDASAIKLHGEFARLNFDQGGTIDE